MVGWTRCHRGVVACVLALAGAPALAQDDPIDPDPPLETPGTPPALVDPQPVSFRGDFIWTRRGPPTVGASMSDVAHFTGGTDLVAATTLDGAVWLWVEAPARSQWFRVLDAVPVGLGAGSDDERLLQEFESALGDLSDLDDTDLDSIFVDDPSEVADDVLAESLAQAEQAAEQVRAELRANPEFFATSDAVVLAQAAVLRGDREAARPRVWFGPDGRLLVGRVDGLWVSDDLGDTWRRTLTVAVTALAWLEERGLWVAGTADGVRFSTDATAWIDVVDGTEGIHVYDLGAAEGTTGGSPGGMYAATASGLWFAPDAQSWEPVGSLRDPVLSVLADPSWERGVWFSTDAAVWRSDDGGVTARATTEAPLPGVVEMTSLGPGRVLVVGAEGPWETLDGGVSWIPLPRGLSDPDTRGVDRAGDRVFLASDEGVFELLELLTASEDAKIAAPTDWVPVEALIETCLDRAGLTEPTPPGPLRLASTFLPTVNLEGFFTPINDRRFSASGGTTFDDNGEIFADQDAFDDFLDDLDADQLQFLRGGTTDGKDIGWGVVLRLEWRPEGRKNSTDIDAIVMDGDLLIDDGRDRSVLTAKVNRGSTEYRQRLISEITAHYYGRQALVARRPILLADTLVDQVELEIQIQELEAYLDALTDGAVSRWESTAENQE